MVSASSARSSSPCRCSHSPRARNSCGRATYCSVIVIICSAVSRTSRRLVLPAARRARRMGRTQRPARPPAARHLQKLERLTGSPLCVRGPIDLESHLGEGSEADGKDPADRVSVARRQRRPSVDSTRLAVARSSRSRTPRRPGCLSASPEGPRPDPRARRRGPHASRRSSGSVGDRVMGANASRSTCPDRSAASTAAPAIGECLVQLTGNLGPVGSGQAHSRQSAPVAGRTRYAFGSIEQC